ncbi:MAG: nucleotide sugar dehydrogenase [Candidatus Magasanikbacteria bacterium]|nr:nucleotide sugar dehydrogenase [Candidatus Magasanikbacteria bacterium]
MILLEELKTKKEKICIVGLGYVGLPLAVLLSKNFNVIGFDINEEKINNLKNGLDKTNEVENQELLSSNVEFTSSPDRIKEAKFIIVAVPTPIDRNKIPDLSILKKASELVGKNLSPGSIIVYESTVYPGVTEDICAPILEKYSNLKKGVEFNIGYSPERVNPGDKKHTIDKITKVVSAGDQQSLEVVAGIYESITSVFKAKSIAVAEAAKVIENTQRDLNIALINELTILFNKMDISIYDVLDAAGTKWNFLGFKPGLVGGHCIGVDPYYLTFKAREVEHNPEVILAGRGINDSMHKYIAHQIIKKMILLGKDVSTSKFVIFGLTFKEDVSDVRNSKVAALYEELRQFGVKPIVYDPLADPKDVEEEYGIILTKKEDLPKADTLIVAVTHDEFRKMTPQEIKEYMNDHNLLLVDFKKIYDQGEIEKEGINYWTL